MEEARRAPRISTRALFHATRSRKSQKRAAKSVGEHRKRAKTDFSILFSRFDPIVAFDAISGNWINVPEVAKLGIQAAHKKLGLAREVRPVLRWFWDGFRWVFMVLHAVFHVFPCFFMDVGGFCLHYCILNGS